MNLKDSYKSISLDTAIGHKLDMLTLSMIVIEY